MDMWAPLGGLCGGTPEGRGRIVSALPRPDLPPGPHRELSTAIHELHHRAGWPSLRTLAREAGISHTTVSKALSSKVLPSWGTLELLVDAMDGDCKRFHDLWIAASSPESERPPVALRIAGRRAELDAVRRHIETDTGLLLVTGEAGMGKTTLVDTARHEARGTAFVATGRCLPFSGEIPLLPFTQALRQVAEQDEGELLRDAVGSCPAYVQAALSTLLPELSTGGVQTDPEDRWLRQRLFSAVGALCERLSSRKRFTLVLEDLHWADELTLDLVDHLFRGTRTTILATWRVDDPDVRADRRVWLARVRREASVLHLGPLSREETIEQLQLLRPKTSREAAATIHARSRGQPLFSEQLAHADAGEPTYLADLLDARIAHLEDANWSVTALLGVADAPLYEADIARATGLAPDQLAPVLRHLRSRQLIGIQDEAVHLKHPLLADAVRRRLLPGERRGLHLSMARLMSASSAPEPAIVARHWQAAGRPEEELTWRIRAARAASERFAADQAAEHWLRALTLWPTATPALGSVRRHELVAGAATQLDMAGRPAENRPLLEAELLTPELYDAAELADVLRLLAQYTSSQFVRGTRGLQLVERAIDIYRGLPPSEGLVAALNWRGTELEWHGRRDEATAALDEAVETAALLGKKLLERSVRCQKAWQMCAAGDPDGMQAMEEALAVASYGVSLTKDLAVGARHTDALLMTCAPPQAVEAAAQPALEIATRWGAGTGHLPVLRSNVALAWLRAGHVTRSLELVDSSTESEEPDTFPLLHIERVVLEVLQGRSESARRRLAHFKMGEQDAIDTYVVQAELVDAVWTGLPEEALRKCLPILQALRMELYPGRAGDLLVLVAWAAADSHRAHTPAARRQIAQELVALRAALHHDPFAPRAVPADRIAARQWFAELDRLDGHDTIDVWVRAARTWDSVRRPHDAAYCRWRAAEVALRHGEGTVAAQLLKRATRDAREHVPLSRAISSMASAAHARP